MTSSSGEFRENVCARSLASLVTLMRVYSDFHASFDVRQIRYELPQRTLFGLET
jgi:hypothetical protein